METRIVEPAEVLDAVRSLKAEGFDMLTDVTAVDRHGFKPAPAGGDPRGAPRFEVVWHFYSTTTFKRVRVKTAVEERHPVVDSLTPFYGSALFAERECHEMYGIVFRGLRDDRPLLLYEGFVGHPLRKDYDANREQPLVPYRK